jgi:hypothetical protein
MKVHYELQATPARLVPDSRLIFVPNTGHFIQRDRPEAVVGAIREVYEWTNKPAGSAELANPFRTHVAPLPAHNRNGR